VLRSNCVVEKVALSKEKALESPDFVKGEVREVCGSDNSLTLAKQMQRTNAALRHLFEVAASVGRCAWPHGKNKWPKINCVQGIYQLKSVKGEPGILFKILAFATLYAAQTDQLLTEPQYGSVLEEKFDIEIDEEAQMPMLEMVQEAEGKSVEVRAATCLNLVAVQRAYERTFSRAALGLEVWFQTFARQRMVPDAFTTWTPCKKVFRSLDKKEGMCMHEDWTIGHRRQKRSLSTLEHEDACESELAKPAWECHKYGKDQDDAWCKTAGVIHGEEYQYFGPNGKCGKCWCCKREAHIGLWVEEHGSDAKAAATVESVDEL